MQRLLSKFLRLEDIGKEWCCDKMAIYWHRCMICGKHKPTASCTIGRRKIEVCPTCYYMLGLWEKCVEKPWGTPSSTPVVTGKVDDKLRELEKLLEKLE